MNATKDEQDTLTLEKILEAIFSLPRLPEKDPFEEMLKRAGYTPEDDVLMIVPLAWLETELEPCLRVRRKWLKLSPHVEQAYIMDVGKVRAEMAKQFERSPFIETRER